MVLRAASEPFWLSSDAPLAAVVMSSRARIARNLWGFAYPHRLKSGESEAVQDAIVKACRGLGWDLQSWTSLSPAEEELFVAARLISPHTHRDSRARMILLDRARSLTIMVNEEDHLRLQTLHPGWSLASAANHAAVAAQDLEREIKFAQSGSGEYLTASSINVGAGTRFSMMCHLFGLAQKGRLKPMIEALGHHDWVVRGVFGESSRAVGAFFQVSTTQGLTPEFLAACEYLIQEELLARRTLEHKQVIPKCEEAVRFAVGARKLKLSEAIRCLSWVRWACYAGIYEDRNRAVDRMISEQGAIRYSDIGQDAADRRRAANLRPYFESCLGKISAPC